MYYVFRAPTVLFSALYSCKTLIATFITILTQIKLCVNLPHAPVPDTLVAGHIVPVKIPFQLFTLREHLSITQVHLKIMDKIQELSARGRGGLHAYAPFLVERLDSLEYVLVDVVSVRGHRGVFLEIWEGLGSLELTLQVEVLVVFLEALKGYTSVSLTCELTLRPSCSPSCKHCT